MRSSGIRKFAAIFRANWAITIEYRVSMFIWMMTIVLPLVMMAGWLAAAETGPVGRFSYADILTYYVGAVIVRNLTGVWIIWELEADIRSGNMSFRLLKPINPIFHYMASSLAPKPLRFLILIPVLVVVWAVVPGLRFSADPVHLLSFVVAIALSWSMMFLQLYTVGLLGFWITRPSALHDVWFGVFSLFSGYLIPIELFPEWAQGALFALPFRYNMSFPIEILTGRLQTTQILEGFAVSCFWILVSFLAFRWVWFHGLRRFNAVGA